MIELVCDKNRAFFRETEKLTSGSIGVTINFVFSPEWDGLLKTAVFEAGDVKNDVVLTADSCEIPPDVLACTDKRLFVGVFGELADKTLVIPTIYAEAGTIKPGASPSGMTSAPPTPSWPEQVQAIALEAKEVADSVRSDADAGKFNGPAGGWYTPAVTLPDANTMRFSFSPSKEGMPAVEETDIAFPSSSGGSGEDGGYYTPEVTQPAGDTMEVSFTPSKATMPKVASKKVTLPAGTAGADGKSAYAYAVEGGYTGTEAEFAAKLAEEIPDLTDTEIITAPGYTNQIPISTDTDESVYNGVGYKSGYYLGSTGSETAGGNTLITGFIPVVKGDVIRIKDAKIDDTLMIALYPASKSPSSNIGKTIANIKSNAIYGSIIVSGNEIVWDTSTIGYDFWNDFAYMRATIWSSNAIITVNEEIIEAVTEKKVLKPDIKVKQGNLDFSVMNPMLSGKNVVFFGDSIFGLTRDSTSVAAYTSQFTGATVFNVGFGGCRMAVHPTSGYAAFSMWALADAVSSGSFTAQEEQAASGEDYFSEQLALLKSIDFSDVDMIVIHYGTNDFTGNVNIDNESDDDDTATLCGALRYSLRKIQTAYPEIRIFVSLPIYRKWNDTGAETYTNSSGNKLWDFCSALAGVADGFNCPIINGYKALGVNSINNSAFSADGVHLNDHGRKVFGEYIGGCLIAPSGTESQEIPSDDHINSLIDTKLGVIENGSY